MELEKSEHRDINISRTLQLEMIRKDGTTVWGGSEGFPFSGMKISKLWAFWA